MSNMDKIIEISEADGDARVQTGVKWEDLNRHLEEKGVPLFFPLDPGPGATIGGMAGTGCSGTNAVRYGTAKAEWFLNLVRGVAGEINIRRASGRPASEGAPLTADGRASLGRDHQDAATRAQIVSRVGHDQAVHRCGGHAGDRHGSDGPSRAALTDQVRRGHFPGRRGGRVGRDGGVSRAGVHGSS